MRKSVLMLAVAVGCGTAWAAAANEFEPQLRALADEQINGWLQTDVVVAAIKAQNDQNAALSQQDIDALDQQWRAEVKGAEKKLVSEIMAKSLSGYLRKVKEDSQGLFTEIFVMDNKGLNVGQSDVTSDYWQGDEDKWTQTFQGHQMHIGDVEQDESTQTFQSQLSLPVSDPASGTVIGAVTVGVNVEMLGQ